VTGDWNPVLAFHHLAALSQVAYWFRNWDIARHIPPLPDYSVGSSTILAEYLKMQAQAQRPTTPPAR
jgi:hypothetical protein